MLEIVFWVMMGVVFYTYIGYGILVFLLLKIRGKRKPPDTPDTESLPSIIHLIAAYNEEDYIEQKIHNSLALEYPNGKHQVWVVTDGSTDGTVDIVKQHPEVKHFHSEERRGKIHAVNRVMPQTTTDIVVFSDANTDINPQALLTIVRHFQDTDVGVVAGEKRIEMSQSEEASTSGEGIYWKYESFLKNCDHHLYSTVGAAGELFAIRTSLFQEVPNDSIIEDFYLSMKIAGQGYRIAYEPEAYAVESGSESVKEESKRKIRIAAGGLQSSWRLRSLLNLFRSGWLGFQFLSHRVLRWTLAPLFMPLIFVVNLLLLEGGQLYQALFLLQCLFYLAAFAGWWLQSRKIKVKALFVPFYFVFMNWAVYLGLLRLVKGNQSVKWEKAARKT